MLTPTGCGKKYVTLLSIAEEILKQDTKNDSAIQRKMKQPKTISFLLFFQRQLNMLMREQIMKGDMSHPTV